MRCRVPSSGGEVQNAQDGILPGTWIVAAIDDVTTTEPRPDLTFTDELRFHGSDGGNRLMGTYSTGAATISLSPVASTMMAGPPEAMAQETRLTRALQGEFTVTRVEGGLLLESGGHSLRLSPADKTLTAS
jgi:heat shock protein HslJ